MSFRINNVTILILTGTWIGLCAEYFYSETQYPFQRPVRRPVHEAILPGIRFLSLAR
jgi:hypothetical protein